MSLRIAAFVLVFRALAGCGKKSAPPKPYAGALTSERILGAEKLVEPYDDWDKGLAKLKAQLGEPTRVKEARYQWAVADADTCTYFEVEQEDRAKYNQGKGPM